MDKNRITGAAKRAKGAIKERIGRLTRNAKLEAEGKAERAVGTARNAAGAAKDAARGATHAAGAAKDAAHGGGRSGRT